MKIFKEYMMMGNLPDIEKFKNTFANTWYKAWLGLFGFDKSNLVPTLVSVGHSDSRLTATTSYHHR